MFYTFAPTPCSGPPICSIQNVTPTGSCQGSDICVGVPDDYCPGVDVCLKYQPSSPEISKISDLSPSVGPRSSDSQLRDTIHYLSPVSSQRAKADVCICEEYECVCEEATSYRFTELSTEEGSQFVEKTLAIIKPDGVHYEDVVLRKLRLEGFQVLGKRVVHLSPEQASEFYSAHYGKIYFPYYVVSLSEAPIIVLCLAAPNGINKWKELIGVNGTIKSKWFHHRSLRYRFGFQSNIENVLYGSPDAHTAHKDIKFFFPQMILEPLLCEDKSVSDYLQIYVNPTLSKGLAEIVKRKPLEPIIAFADWLLENNPYQPKMLPTIAKLPT